DQVSSVPNTRVVRLRFSDLGDTLHGSLNNVVHDRLLQRVVKDGPGKDSASLEPRCGREVELSSQRRLIMELPDYLHPFASFVVRMMRFIVKDQQVSSSKRNAVRKISWFEPLGRRLGTQHACHYVGFFASGSVRLFMELLDVREKECAIGRSCLRLATHHTLEIPENLELFGDDRVGTED